MIILIIIFLVITTLSATIIYLKTKQTKIPAKPGSSKIPPNPTPPKSLGSPSTPAKPTSLGSPSTPAKPTSPSTPAPPASSGSPSTPAKPTSSSTPATPTSSSTPAKPTSSSTPAPPASSSTSSSTSKNSKLDSLVSTGADIAKSLATAQQAAALAVSMAAEAAAKKVAQRMTGKVQGELFEWAAKKSSRIVKKLLVEASEQLAKLGVKAGQKLALKAATKAATTTAAKIGAKVAAQSAIAAETGPGAPFVEAGFFAFDVLSIGLDMGDAGGYGNMGTNESYFKMRDGVNKELQDAMVKAGASWPIYIGPLSNIVEAEYNELLKVATEKIFEDSKNPLVKPMYDAITADAEAGIDVSNKSYDNLIDNEKIFKQAAANICILKGGKVIGDQCSYSTKNLCDKSYTWPLKEDSDETYVEWKSDNGGSCQMASFAMRGICESVNRPYDDKTGSCLIDENYCKTKGADWKYNDKIKSNDCVISDGQQFLELLIGTTITRGMKQIFDEDQYKKCNPGEMDNGYTCSRCPGGKESDDSATKAIGYGTPLGLALNKTGFANLCYTPCRTGYDGVGPVCWGHTYVKGERVADKAPCAPGLRDDGTSCWKDTYGVGVGRAASLADCAPGLRDDGTSCWKDTYGVGVGRPANKAGCAPGLRDDGTSCWKDTYGRGVGTVPNMTCPDGYKFEGVGLLGGCTKWVLKDGWQWVMRTNPARHGCKGDSKHKIWELSSRQNNGAGPPYTFTFGNDGNICVLDKNGIITHCSNTYPGGGGRNKNDAATYKVGGPFKLVMQDDGNLVIYTVNGGRVVWASGSNQDTGWYDYDSPDQSKYAKVIGEPEIPVDRRIPQDTMIYSSNKAFYLLLRSSDGRLVIYESGEYPGDLDAGLCYKRCRDGYDKAGALCIPHGGAGIRTALWDRWQCNPDEDNNKAGMCYPKCRDGYHKAGDLLCEPNGGPGIKTTAYDRYRCRDNEQHNGLGMCYPKCRDGYHKAGDLLCEPDDGPGIKTTVFDRYRCRDNEDNPKTGICYDKCRTGMEDRGGLCATPGSPSYPRGAGTTPNTYPKKRAVGFSTQDN